MAEIAHSFDDSAAYERFVGHWGRAAGAIFLDWVAPPSAARWLDVGCGTGLFTELILETRSPTAVFAIDQAEAQIDYARCKPTVSERISELVMHTYCLFPMPRSTSWFPRLS